MPASVTDLVNPKNKKIKATLAEKADLITSHVSGKNSFRSICHLSFMICPCHHKERLPQRKIKFV